tara:strand:- start:60 stop:281 length:222 start_codon:yes stop_codon:yes gene_type:complete
MNNYLVFFIFVILFGGLNFFIHRYLMSNWDYYRDLQKKNPSPIELGILIIIMNAWIFLIVLVLVFFFGDEWLI